MSSFSIQPQFLGGVGYNTLTHQMTNQCSVVLGVDGYNQASPGPSGNQGQMMGMSGRGGPIAPEGTTNMGTPLMSENGTMVMYQKKISLSIDYTARTLPQHVCCSSKGFLHKINVVFELGHRPAFRSFTLKQTILYF